MSTGPQPGLSSVTTLVRTLLAIELIDPSNDAHPAVDSVQAATDYAIRAELVYTAMGRAASLGYRCGFAFDPKEPDWPVAYIDLPEVGQVSWHMAKYPGEFDGHTTGEKYDRIARYARQHSRQVRN